jgi:hypothetical protein
MIMAKTPHNCECKKEKPQGCPPRGLSSNGSEAVFHPEATGFGPPGAQRYALGDRADAHKKEKEKETSVCKLREICGSQTHGSSFAVKRGLKPY